MKQGFLKVRYFRQEPSSGLFNDDTFPSRDEMNDEEIMKHHLDYFDSASSR